MRRFGKDAGIETSIPVACCSSPEQPQRCHIRRRMQATECSAKPKIEDSKVQGLQLFAHRHIDLRR